jgi:Tetratricopeptide repeat
VPSSRTSHGVGGFGGTYRRRNPAFTGQDRLGADDGHVLRAVNTLAGTLGEMGCYAEARELDEDSLSRERRLRGEDHPDTLTSAGNLANDLRELGEFEAARVLGGPSRCSVEGERWRVAGVRSR